MAKTYQVTVTIQAHSYRLSAAGQGYHVDFFDAVGKPVGSMDNVILVDLVPGADEPGTQLRTPKKEHEDGSKKK